MLLIVGGYFVLTTGFVSRFMDWMKPNDDKFMRAKIFCADRQIRDRKLVVCKYVLSDHKKRRAFYLVQKLLITNPRGKSAFLPLTERGARPIDFHSKMTENDWETFPTARRVFLDTTADIRSEASAESNKNLMAQSLSIIALAAAVIVVVMVAVVFIQTRG
jgi:hypothetical protein